MKGNQRVFFPKDDNLKNMLMRLEKDKAICTSHDNAKRFSKYRPIRDMRHRDELFIGMDRRKKVSVIVAIKPIKRKGNGFLL